MGKYTGAAKCWGWMLQTNEDLSILASVPKCTTFLLNRPYITHTSKSIN